MAGFAFAGRLAIDVLFTGEGGEEIGAVIYPAPGAREDPELRARIATALARLAVPGAASSRRIARATIASDDPSLATGEVTDKGTLNRRIALRVRAAEIARLAAGGVDTIAPP